MKTAIAGAALSADAKPPGGVSCRDRRRGYGFEPARIFIALIGAPRGGAPIRARIKPP
jgi:hypothetical protein